MNIFLRWLLVSSKDPRNTSLAFLSVLLGIVPMVMKVIGIACGFHLFCLAVTGDDLASIAQEVSNVVFFALSIIASVGFVYGLARKIWLTLWGENKAVQ